MAQGKTVASLLEGGATGNIYFETVQSGLLAGFTFHEILFEESTEFQQATLVQTEAFGGRGRTEEGEESGTKRGEIREEAE